MTPFQHEQLVLMRQMENTPTSTIVPMQTDYINDPQLCLTCVSFIPKNIVKTIQTTIINPLSSLEPNFYYYPAESLHITIQNIRVINNPPHFGPAEIAKAQKLLTTWIPKHGPCTFRLSGVLSMPTSVSIIALVTPGYDRFVKSLRQKLAAAGIPDDKKYVTKQQVFANVTVCRYTHKPSQTFLGKLQHLREKYFGTLHVQNVSLIVTNAGAHPSKTTVFGTYRFASI